MPSPALVDAVDQVPRAGHDGADRGGGVRGARRRQDLAGARIDRVACVAAADGRPVVAARDVEQRRGAERPLVREEVRHLPELVVLRLLPREAQPVVERQPRVHLPVVLQVELGVVVDHAAFDQRRLLQVLREHTDGRVGETEAGIERVVGVVPEVDVALEPEIRHAARAGVLRLEAVVVVEAGLAGVAAPHLRQADRHVLRAVDVQESGKDLIGRPRQRAHAGRAHDAVPPAERRRQIDPRAVEPARAEIGQHLVRVIARIDVARVRIDQREVRHALQPVRRVGDEHAACSGGADRRAAGELIADESVRALDERRGVHDVVAGDAVVGDERVRIEHVVEVRRVVPGVTRRRARWPEYLPVNRSFDDSW